MTRLAALLLVALALPASALASWTPPEDLGTVSVAGPAGGPQFADDGSALAVISEHTRQLEGYTGRVDILRTPSGDWSSRLSEVEEHGLDAFRQTVAGDGSVVLLGFATT